MGIKSTYHIDRQTALSIIVGKIAGCTNEQLASMLEEFEESHFRNYIVEDQVGSRLDDNRVIRNVSEF